jgi:hypothetical protein
MLKCRAEARLELLTASKMSSFSDFTAPASSSMVQFSTRSHMTSPPTRSFLPCLRMCQAFPRLPRLSPRTTTNKSILDSSSRFTTSTCSCSSSAPSFALAPSHQHLPPTTRTTSAATSLTLADNSNNASTGRYQQLTHTRLTRRESELLEHDLLTSLLQTILECLTGLCEVAPRPYRESSRGQRSAVAAYRFPSEPCIWYPFSISDPTTTEVTRTSRPPPSHNSAAGQDNPQPGLTA